MLTELLILKIAELEAFVDAYENPEQDEEKYKELLRAKRAINKIGEQLDRQLKEDSK